MSQTVQSPFIEALRPDAAKPIAENVEALNRFEPEVLVAYASMLRMLAEEQLAGHLRIRPRAVNCSSEVPHR